MFAVLDRIKSKVEKAPVAPCGALVKAAILHLDIVGSTRLVCRDLWLAHQRIRYLYRRIRRLCELHQGIARELRGDAAVVEFPTAGDALQAALAIQRAGNLLDQTRVGQISPRIRIGISYGPVVSDEDMITGLAVIRAQRIEQLAEPGKVWFDQSVYERLESLPQIEIASLGSWLLKGFDRPQSIYSAVYRHCDALNGLDDDFQSLLGN